MYIYIYIPIYIHIYLHAYRRRKGTCSEIEFHCIFSVSLIIGLYLYKNVQSCRVHTNMDTKTNIHIQHTYPYTHIHIAHVCSNTERKREAPALNANPSVYTQCTFMQKYKYTNRYVHILYTYVYTRKYSLRTCPQMYRKEGEAPATMFYTNIQINLYIYCIHITDAYIHTAHMPANI